MKIINSGYARVLSYNTIAVALCQVVTYIVSVVTEEPTSGDKNELFVTCYRSKISLKHFFVNPNIFGTRKCQH